MRAPKISVLFSVTIALLLALGVGILTREDIDHPDPEFLSTDLHFQVGEIVISVPVVAMRAITTSPDNADPLPHFRISGGPFGTPRDYATREYKTALIELAGDSARPAEVSSIRLNFGSYGTYGEFTKSGEICPRLTQDWSRKACENQLRTELRYLPTVVYLATRSGLDQALLHRFADVFGASSPDLIEDMPPNLRAAKMACADDQRFCYSAIMVSERLYAVWSASCSDIANEDCQNELEAQRAAIKNFVSHELRVE